ncbi:NACHT domain-containing protein [Alkalinema sp. FACHB-956]|uniref:NACHT domain-containing protein n=1 Tax=Alkalinema sp. FACHB-956 TaxID=2692768 RepID=UPI001684B3FF|nr:NACHT domain-containing protein [Alkalinema sp. FACHB-956]MBD2325652.1 NACHT domain-containing protein [Alkalinema sp. FACHB-956]
MVFDLLAKALDMLIGSQLVKDKLQRNEHVIRLLKQLGLSPDQPPADFDGVYTYALVEYGVGKPKPCLEIFRQSEIRKIFKTAFGDNNAQHWLTSGEQFLDQSPIGQDVRSIGLDPKRELAAFAACFITVTKQTRNPSEVMLSHQVTSVQQTLQQLHERLDRLPSLEGIRTELANLAGAQPALLSGAATTTSHPAQSCRAFALGQQVRGWFETLGYRFESYEVWDATYFEWIINIPVRRGRYDRILVRGVDGEVGVRDVRSLAEVAAQQKTDEGWLVTARRISQAARNVLEQPDYESLAAFTLDELLDQDADFTGYLDWLAAEIAQRGVEARYVPLACTKEEVDPITHQRLGISRYGAEDGWTEGYLDRWLDDPAKEHLSILGEFGTGKTWLTLHYAAQVLRQYREAQAKGMARPRLPIVVPLRDYAKAVSVESLFSEFFFRKHEIPIPGYSAFEQLNRMGKLLLIFDGFDEMAARVDKQQMINNFWELAKVVVPGSKVILTCRTEHFPEAREGRALLNAELQASTRDLTGETPQFEVLELEKFDDGQIRQVLQLQAAAATVDQVMGNPQLLDLARRPVMTELILEALPDIEAGKPVDMSRVYLYAVRRKMERDIKAERTFTSMADKLYFLCELSWEMLSTDRMSLNYREFPDRLRKLFGSAVQEEKDLDHWHYDMMGQTMLIRNAEGDYTPAHRSLLEFFVAFKFAAELGALAPDFLELAQMRGDIDRALEPHEYTWSEYFETRDQVAPLASFKTESLEKLHQTIGKKTLTKALVELITPILTTFRRNPTHPLQLVIEATRNDNPKVVDYLGGNTATLLTLLDRSALAAQDLSNTVIRNADLVNANLNETNFKNAVLEQSTFPQIFGAVFTISYSHDGKIFATASAICTIDLWNTKDNQLITSFKGHTNWVRSLEFSADNTLLISAAFDSTIRVWDVKTGKCLQVLLGHTDRINSVTMSLDKKYIISGSDDRTIKVWDWLGQKCLHTLEGHTSAVEAVVIQDMDKVLISGASDQSIRIWDLETGTYLRSLSGHTHRVRSLALSPDGRTLASGSRDQTIRLWHLDTGECLKVLEGHSDKRVYSVKFSPDGTLLASACYDQTIRVWEVESGECLKILLGHVDWVRAVAFHPNGLQLTSGSDDQTIKHWDISTGECIATLQGYTGGIRSISLSPDEQTLVLGCEDKGLRIWQGMNFDNLNVRTGRNMAFLAHESRINSVAISPSGNSIATASFDRLIKLWDLNTGQCLKVLAGHERPVNAVIFNSDGSLLISTGADLTVRIWSIDSGECISVFKAHDNWLWAIAISPDDSLIASGGDDQVIGLWELSTGICIGKYKEHKGGINSIVFTHSGEVILTAGADGIIRLWNTADMRCFKKWIAHDANILSLSVSTDDRLLASASQDFSIKLWNLSTGELLHTLEGHRDSVHSTSFTKDSSKVISGSSDQTIRIWDVQTGKCLQTLHPRRPYEGMNITGVKGLTPATIASLKALGAVEDEE